MLFRGELKNQNIIKTMTMIANFPRGKRERGRGASIFVGCDTQRGSAPNMVVACDVPSQSRGVRPKDSILKLKENQGMYAVETLARLGVKRSSYRMAIA